MATTKAYELAQLSNDLTVDSDGNLVFDTTIDVDYLGFDSDLAQKTTDDLTEGDNNLYYTTVRADSDFDVRIATKDTDDVAEGSTNLFYTTARADSDTAAYLAGDRTFGNITTTGYIAGPATFTIDPAAVGDNTGTVVIAGSLQVDGTTTTINSSTMTVDDLNIVLASGAANAAAANGAGITIDGASATITYDATNDEWDFNKDINVTGNIIVSGNVDGRDISGITATNAELNVLDGITATTAELNYTDGVTSNIQTQLNAKANLSGATFTGAISGTSISLSSTITATPGSTLIVYNSAGTAVKTVHGITSA